MVIIGIDPGSDGAIAIAIAQSEGPPKFQFRKMAKGVGAKWSMFSDLDGFAMGHAYVEQVGQFNPKAEPHLVRSNLGLRQELGELTMACQAKGFSFETVTAQKWQKWLYPGLPKGRDNGPQRKSLIHSRVLERIQPAQYVDFKKIPKYAADAFALALYGIEHNKHW